MKRTLIPIILLAGLPQALVSCQPKTQGEAPPPAPLRLATLTLKPGTVLLEDSVPASIKGRQDVDLYPQITGRLTEIHVQEGQRVSKGQKLFVIDPVPYEAALHMAEADVQAARAGVESAALTAEGKRRLHEGQVISRHELLLAESSLHAAEAQLKQAEASLSNARNNLSYTVISSPVDGVAGTLPYRAGALVSPNSSEALTTVSDSSEIHVYFTLPESRVLELVRTYGSMEATLQQLPPLQLQLHDGSLYGQEGHVEGISGVADASTGSVTFRAAFPNSKGLLLSGNSGNILIQRSIGQALTIPQSATFEIQDKVFAYKLGNGRATPVQLQVTPLPAQKAYMVTNGLMAGDTIITEGVSLLKEGAAVEPKEPTSPAP